mmetsp:Transcript_44207/g.37090  ORF Transcript_44207/g.37090 Transcript_44207/m.37090 type:complete len:82 (+) Transcript_44207:465-710(+)
MLGLAPEQLALCTDTTHKANQDATNLFLSLVWWCNPHESAQASAQQPVPLLQTKHMRAFACHSSPATPLACVSVRVLPACD